MSPRADMATEQQQIVDELARFAAVLGKYEHLVSLGRALPEADASLRRDEHAVPGCQSRVWIRSRLEEGRLRIEADGEAVITRGLIALLLRVLDDRTPEEIVEQELFFLERTGLGAQLSPARSNGLAAMVREIRRQAAAAKATA